jgi:hypothetical protein
MPLARIDLAGRTCMVNGYARGSRGERESVLSTTWFPELEMLRFARVAGRRCSCPASGS